MNANLWTAYDATRLEQLDGEKDMRMNVFRSFAGIAAIAVATLVFGQQPGAPSAAAKASAAEKGAAETSQRSGHHAGLEVGNACIASP